MNPDHLLDQAGRLIRPDVGRPRQTDLRRAVSACYYALFHHLIDLACQQAVGTAPERSDMRHTIARGFSHGEMNDASRTFSGGTLPAHLAGGLAGASVPSEVRNIAIAFFRLQAERHVADYDRSHSYTQEDVGTLIDLAAGAVQLARDVKSNDFGRLYLSCLLTWGKLRR